MLLTACVLQAAHAQSKIHGLVVDVNGKPVPQANVLLLHAKDSSLVKGMVTTTTGFWSFNNTPAGTYIITSTFIGFKKVYTPLFKINNNSTVIDAGTLTLLAEEKQLNNVTVTARKPLFEQKIDRMVVNVANSITSAGNTALEVLERSPGVMVDNQNNVLSINGKNGVVLMMNGKISYMPMAAAIQMLAGMSSTNIEKIEIITTPPANLDAEGNAGYINIVLKSNDNFGTNGSYSLTAGYGKGIVSAGSINLNHRKGKVNLYGDLSYSRVKTVPNINVYSKISNKGIVTETYAYVNRSDTTRNVNGRLGMDYELSKHTVIGILFSAYDNHYSQSESNTSSRIKNNLPDTSLKLNNTETNRWQNVSGNINLQHSFKEGENVSVNFDYIHYRNRGLDRKKKTYFRQSNCRNLSNL